MESMNATQRKREVQSSHTIKDRNINGSAIDREVIYTTTSFYLGVKRVLDIGFALLCLIILIPIFLVIAVCIKLEDGGDIFYFRKMIGLRGSYFYIVKFRTMIINADAYLEQHPELNLEYQKNMKLQNDPRVTRIGKFLRRSYLDELPQLFNVLAGQMSLIGPRAIHLRELALYGKYAQKRHSVKPGITGLWQVSQYRYQHYEERIALDMHYIDSLSFYLDLAILLKTLKVVVGQTGV